MSKTQAAKPPKGRAAKALGDARESLESNPLAILAGGIAIGLAAGLAIPRAAREKQFLGPLGKRLADGAGAAAKAAREAGKAELDAILPNRDATRDQVARIVGSVVGAATDAGKAAGKAAGKTSGKAAGRKKKG